MFGISARYNPANLEALRNLPWPPADLARIERQAQYLRTIPQVPGGYYTARHINNAFVRVVIGRQMGPRDALLHHVRYINEEIRIKRQEFGLVYE